MTLESWFELAAVVVLLMLAIYFFFKPEPAI